MYRGSVANNQDPLNEARVTLLIPQVLGNAESAWAVPASPTNTIPPVGQTLWVQFSGGDITKPVYSPLGIKDVQDQVDQIGTGGDSLDALPPKEPTALTLTTVQYVTDEGATQARVTASWTPPTENQDGTSLVDLSHYLLQTSYDNSNWSGGWVTTEDLVLLDGLNTGVTFYVRVAAIDTSNNTSLWATSNITTASASTPPPVPSAPGVVGVLGGLRVTWDGLDSTGTAMPAIFSHVQVQRDTTSNFSNPVVVGTLPGPDFLYDPIQNYASAYYYRLVAYSKVGIASAPSASNSDTPKQAVAQDILDASLTSAKIAVGAIDSTKLAAGAVDTQAVADGAIAAGKLAAQAVATTNIADGAVTGTQLADATIGSAKIINGAIGTAQIADAAINNAKISDLDAGKINVGTLNAARIAAGSLDASKITSGTVTSTQIQAGSITGDRLAANTVTANQIAANTITANQMAAGTITAQSGVIASIDASKITVGKVSASQIDATNLVVSGANVSGQVSSAATAGSATTAGSASSATTVTGSIGAGVSIPANQLNNGTIPTTTTINGGSITTGTISASVIGARSITTDKMVIGDTSNILLDPQFTQNSTSWNWNSNIVRTVASDPSVPTGAPAAYVAKIANQTNSNTDLTWKHTTTTTTGMPVTPGESYYVEAWVAASPDCNANLRFFLTVWDANGANVTWPSVGTTLPSAAQTWTKISGQITIPAGKYLATFGIGSTLTSPTTAAGSWFVTNVKMRKAIDNALVVAGTLTADKISAGALTVDKLSAGLQATVGQKFYDFGLDASKWSNGSTGTMTTVSVPDAASGGYVMRCTGYVSGAYRPDILIPFDPGVTYRVTARIRQTVANSVPGTNQNVYVGVTGIAADGVTLVNTAGSNSRSSQAYCAAKSVWQTTGGGWTVYTGYIKGTASTGDPGPNTSPTSPMRLHQNVRYISPSLYVNNSGGDGTAEVDMFTIEVVETGQVNSANINLGNVNASHLSLGTVTGNLVTNPGFEDNSLVGWTTSSSGSPNTAKIEIGAGTSPARSGQGKASLGAVNTGWAKILSAPFPVVAGATYMFRYWYYGSGGLQATFETSPDQVTWTDQMAGANNKSTNNTTGYSEDIFEMTAPTGALWGRVSFSNNSPGTATGLDTTSTWWLCIDDVLVMREGYGATDISAAGVRLYGPDGTLNTELTTANAYATFAGGKASIDPNGVGTFNSLWTPQRPAGASSDDPTGQFWYQGQELSNLLWNMPWGMVTYERGWTNKPTSSTYYTTDTGLIELAFTAVEGRMYRIVARSQFDFNGGTGNQVLENRIAVAATATSLNGCTVWSPTGASPQTTDPIMARCFGMYYDGGGTDGTTVVEGLIVCSSDGGGNYGATTCLAPGDHRILWIAAKHAGNATGWGLRNYSPAQSSDFYVEDIGPAVHEGGVYNTGGAAVTATKTYTKTYNAVWSRRFGNAGYTDGSMYQGYYSSTWGQQKSMVYFGTQPYTDMGSTAKVSKVEVYLYANHWYYNAGGTAHIGVFTNTSEPTGFAGVGGINQTVSSWPVGAGKWVTLPSSWNSSWNAGTPYRGITLGGDLSTTDKTYYGIFDGVGDTHPPQLRITYTK
ncbi:phage baseplate assembly protein V [Streptomyces sp. BK022]|uniref:phage baseplate assembly protein V n=1 Tax=Streptomyces sp. BK022 TaxID=2512123 RepID=UPI001029CD8A|nr:phage baseplate assembly protein V [Streptomyces sp. BK022]